MALTYVSVVPAGIVALTLETVICCGILAWAKVPDVIFDAARFGILSALKAPVDTFDASSDGIRAAAKVPLVTFDASRFGMRAAANVPLVILPAGKLGICETSHVCEYTASSDVSTSPYSFSGVPTVMPLIGILQSGM